MLKLSKREDYSLVLLSELVANYQRRVTSISEISKKYNISAFFLRNLMAELKKRSFVKAKEGKNGGYFLTKDPKNIKIGEALDILSKPILDCCATRGIKIKNKCSNQDLCRPSLTWKKLNKEFLDKVSTLTLLDFFNYK